MVELPTLDLRVGLDLGVVSSSPTFGSALRVEPTLKKMRWAKKYILKI